jgi:hypothetical protein
MPRWEDTWFTIPEARLFGLIKGCIRYLPVTVCERWRMCPDGKGYICQRVYLCNLHNTYMYEYIIKKGMNVCWELKKTKQKGGIKIIYSFYES